MLSLLVQFGLSTLLCAYSAFARSNLGQCRYDDGVLAQSEHGASLLQYSEPSRQYRKRTGALQAAQLPKRFSLAQTSHRRQRVTKSGASKALQSQKSKHVQNQEAKREEQSKRPKRQHGFQTEEVDTLQHSEKIKSNQVPAPVEIETGALAFRVPLIVYSSVFIIGVCAACYGNFLYRSIVADEQRAYKPESRALHRVLD